MIIILYVEECPTISYNIYLLPSSDSIELTYSGKCDLTIGNGDKLTCVPNCTKEGINSVSGVID